MSSGDGGWRERLPPFLSSRTRRAAWQRTKARRVLSAVLAGATVWLLGAQLVPHPVEVGVPVVVVARALPIGAAVSGSNVRTELRPPSQRPDGALTSVGEAVGRVSAGPLTTGEVLTTGRFTGPALLAGLPAGLVAMSVPLLDPGILPAVRPADSVQVIAPGTGQTIAAAARVLSVDPPDPGLLGTDPGSSGRLVLAVSTDEARALAASMATTTGVTGFVLALQPP